MAEDAIGYEDSVLREGSLELESGGQVVLAPPAEERFRQLSRDDQLKVLADMTSMKKSPDNKLGKRVAGNVRFYRREITDDLRMLYRKVDKTSPDAPQDFAILDFIRPEDPLWELTDLAL